MNFGFAQKSDKGFKNFFIKCCKIPSAPWGLFGSSGHSILPLDIILYFRIQVFCYGIFKMEEILRTYCLLVVFKIKNLGTSADYLPLQYFWPIFAPKNPTEHPGPSCSFSEPNNSHWQSSKYKNSICKYLSRVSEKKYR